MRVFWSGDQADEEVSIDKGLYISISQVWDVFIGRYVYQSIEKTKQITHTHTFTQCAADRRQTGKQTGHQDCTLTFSFDGATGNSGGR